MKQTISIQDPVMARAVADDPRFVSTELFVSKATSEHLFAPGEKAVLAGLVDFTELNGREVTITNIREDGPYGRAYYIDGDLENLLNFTYENRLQKLPTA